MNLPKIEICIEGYDIEQTDFYLSMLNEKNENLSQLYDEAKCRISLLTEANEKLHKDFLTLTKQFSDTVSSTDNLIYEKLLCVEKKIDLLLSSINSMKNMEDIMKNYDNSNQSANAIKNETVNKNIIDLRDELAELRLSLIHI